MCGDLNVLTKKLRIFERIALGRDRYSESLLPLVQLCQPYRTQPIDTQVTN